MTARTPISALPRFGYPELRMLSGTIGLEAQMELGPNHERTKAKVDLREAGVKMPKWGVDKPAGAPAQLAFTAEKKDGKLTFNDIDIAGEGGLRAKGSARFTDKLDDIAEIRFTGLKVNRTDLDEFHYALIPGGYRVQARGDSLDLRSLTEGEGENTFSFKNFPALDLALDVKRMVLGEGRELAQVKGEMKCAEICASANVAGMAGGKPFTFRIGKGGGGRAFSLEAEDAGAMLRATNVYDNMKGGQLAVNGKWEDGKPGRPLIGGLYIREYTVENAPVLAKLLALSSLGSLLDSLQGKGIQFEKMEAPFTLENDVLTFKDMKTHGSAMGLSADGTIVFPAREMKFSGTVVPSYTLNTVLGNVPILGDVLTDGGEGIIGAKYTLKGTGDEVDVSVNPLSILTPGFLRGIWGD